VSKSGLSLFLFLYTFPSTRLLLFLSLSRPKAFLYFHLIFGTPEKPVKYLSHPISHLSRNPHSSPRHNPLPHHLALLILPRNILHPESVLPATFLLKTTFFLNLFHQISFSAYLFFLFLLKPLHLQSLYTQKYFLRFYLNLNSLYLIKYTFWVSLFYLSL
jgi:hypothetical protein